MNHQLPHASILVLMFTVSITVWAQQEERSINKLSWRTEPVKIVKIKSKNKTLELGLTFVSDDDWLNGLTITAENIANQAIARIELELAFPPTGRSSPEKPTVVVPMIFGRDPLFDSSETTLDLVVPGERVDIKLLDSSLVGLKEDLEKLGDGRKIKNVQIRVRSVIFADESEWIGDEILYPDPANPKRRINPSKHLQGARPSRDLSAVSERVNVFPFLNVGMKRAHASNMSSAISGRSAMLQLPETLPCDSIHIESYTNACGPVGENCTYSGDTFVENVTPEQVWQVNARSEFIQTRCRKSNGTDCSPNSIPIKRRLPCKMKVAGTCFAIADWVAYPSTGCITGLLFGGPCMRSYEFRSRCADPTGYEQETCSCPDGTTMSPIVIDVDHSGFQMTDAISGVVFNMLNDGVPLPISWTARNSTNAFLALDRNGNEAIDSGAELFGDVTPQPASTEPNGFLALGEFDKAASGGNGNGKIERTDAIFGQLRLWQDRNHNGVSETSELKSLPQLGISTIDLDYKESKSTDEFGNRFKYRAKVYASDGTHAGRWAWDVFITVAQ